MALKPLKPPKLKKPPVYKPPKLASFSSVARKPTPKPPMSTTAGLTPYTGYTGPGVQDFINQGTIQFDSGLGNIGYKPPPSAVPSFAGGEYGGGGGLIGGDWEVQDAEAQMASQMARARGDFQAGLRQHLIDLGLSDTTQLGSLGQYIDKDTIQKAVENKYSATAQIGQQAERTRASNNAALAARGLLSSGQTTKSQQDVSSAAESGRYSALREFLSGGQQGLSGLADLEYQMAQGVAQARQAAAMRAADLYPDSFLSAEEAGPTQMSAPAAPARAPLLGRKAWLTRNPGGRYQNYLRAYRRHQRLGQ